MRMLIPRIVSRDFKLVDEWPFLFPQQERIRWIWPRLAGAGRHSAIITATGTPRVTGQRIDGGWFHKFLRGDVQALPSCSQSNLAPSAMAELRLLQG